MSKMEGETNFSRRLKQLDGLTWLTPTPHFTTDLRHCHHIQHLNLWNTREKRRPISHRLRQGLELYRQRYPFTANCVC